MAGSDDSSPFGTLLLFLRGKLEISFQCTCHNLQVQADSFSVPSSGGSDVLGWTRLISDDSVHFGIKNM